MVDRQATLFTPPPKPKGHATSPRDVKATYDATSAANKRRTSTATITTEDKELDSTARRLLNATALDQYRNFTLAGWMMRKHCDMVSDHRLSVRTGDRGLDREIERRFATWARAENCDQAGRLDLDQMIWILEMTATLQGDAALVRLANGRLAGVEGSRIAKPTRGGLPEPLAKLDLVHGLELGASGRIRRAIICKREGQGLAFDIAPRAANFFLHGHTFRFDQVRGVSPFVGALNTLKDVYEAFDYNLIKSKFQAMFGIAIKSNPESYDGDGFTRAQVDADLEDDPANPGFDPSDSAYDFDIRPGLKLELEPGDDIQTIESRNPSSEFQNFSQLMIRVAMLALDIPYTFLDSTAANFSARIGDNMQYRKSARRRQASIRKAYDWITAWKFRTWIQDGTIRLPASANLTWKWLPAGLPQTDPTKEVKGNRDAVASLQKSPQMVAAEEGLDAFDVLEEIAEFEATARALGVKADWMQDQPTEGIQS